MYRRLTMVGCAVALGLSGAVQAAAVSGQGTWETTLFGRDANGTAVPLLVSGIPNPNAVFIYDSTLDVTWLANANAGAGSIYDNGSSTTDGEMTWANAMAWADNLSYTVGTTTYDDWRLPFVTDTGTPLCNFAYSGTDCGYNVQTKDGSTVYSELAHMYYVTLGNKAPYDTNGADQSGWGLTNTGPFRNLQSGRYWSGTEYTLNGNQVWVFANYGVQINDSKLYDGFAWAVRPGDVAAPVVPLPAALPLFGSALAVFGLLGWRRKKLAA